ncbi:hypothetical protein II5_05773 [Bacillus cereus MSX-A1]|uniref:hypothetical protein n=1 Tax=Bacillus cereus TaxID=1396 RepID=UPI000279580F|nr:hypothetical protein [Bacillus cereus]EJQ99031.1 hypothetical protein II5_05773 [Bacillus cereus MSX-A1]MDR4291034.1 hypothetical protein [Bacillus cereus]
MDIFNNAKPVSIIKTEMLEYSKELILFHHPGTLGAFFHSFDEVPDSEYLNRTVRLTLHQFTVHNSDPNLNNTSPPNSSTYTVPLDHFLETTVIITQLENGTDYTNAIIVNDSKSESSHSSINYLESSPFIRAPKGETCFGRSEERSYFLMADFNESEAQRIAEAMLLVSQSLCSKLVKFEAALPAGAGGRVWNIRKSQNREPLTIVARSEACGRAQVRSGRETHPIGFSLNPSMVQNSSIMGIAVVIIHEISHQFGVLHDGWMNTGDYEGALWASHNVDDVKRSDIEHYINRANAEISGC